jgi:hypothetical protein
MVDYFGDNTTGASNAEPAASTGGAAQPAATNGEDLGMDEISVSSGSFEHILKYLANPVSIVNARIS